VLLLAVPVLTLGPSEVGTIRLAGVTIAWWYAIVLAPVFSVLITLLAMLRPRAHERLPAHTPSRDRDRAAAVLRRRTARRAGPTRPDPPPVRASERPRRTGPDAGAASSDARGSERDRGAPGGSGIGSGVR
jgi:hypothetical protein